MTHETSPNKSKATETNHDILYVQQLLDDAPPSAPSNVISSVDEARKQRHAETLNLFHKSLTQVNEDIEQRVTKESYVVKTHLNNFCEDLKNIVRKWKQLKLLNSSYEDFEEEWDGVEKLYEDWIETVDLYYKNLDNLEEERLTMNKEVMRQYYADFQKISYVLPLNLQKYFEFEILKINRVVLNNQRCYADIYLHLKLLAWKEKANTKQELEIVKEIWKNEKMNFFLSEISNFVETFEDGEACFEEEKDCQDTVRTFNDALTSLTALISSMETFQPENFSKVGVEMFTTDANGAIDHLDITARAMLEKFGDTMERIYSICDQSVEDIKNRYQQDRVCSNFEFESIALEKYLSMLENLKSKHKDDMNKMEAHWMKILLSIQECIKTLYEYFNEIVELWYGFNERISSRRRSICKHIQENQTELIKRIEDKEAKFNIAIDSLKQEYEDKELQKSLSNTCAILDDIREIHKNTHDNNSKMLDSYKNMILLSLSMFEEESKSFLEKNTVEDLAKIETDFEDSSDQGGIFKHLNSANSVLGVIGNTKLSLYHAIKNFQDDSGLKIQEDAAVWINDRKQYLLLTHEAKMELHEMRYPRVVKEVYDARVEEVKVQNDNFEKHEKAVAECIQNIPNVLKDFQATLESIQNDALQKCLCLTEETEKPLKPKDAEIRYNLVKELNDSYKSTIKRACLETQSDLKSKMNLLKNKNISFMKSLKLFSDGGRHHADQVQEIVNKIEKINKNIATEETKAIKVINNSEQSAISSGKKQFDTFTMKAKGILSDFQFVGNVAPSLYKTLSAIKMEVAIFDKEGAEIQESCKAFKAMVSNDPISVQKLGANFKELVSKMKSRYIRLASESEGDSISQQRTKGIPTSKSFLKRKTKLEPTIRPGAKFNDYQPLLYGPQVPSEDKRLYSSLQIKLWQVLEKIQSQAMAYYGDKGTRASCLPNVIPGGFDEFMSDVIYRMKQYDTQFKEYIRNCIKEYLVIIPALLNAVNTFCENSVSQFHEQHMQVLQEEHKIFLTEVDNIMTRNRNAIALLESELKPLHGYPGNNGLLISLTEKVDKQWQEYKHTVLQAISKYKIPTSGKYKKDINNLQNFLQHVTRDVFSLSYILPLQSYLIKSLMEQPDEQQVSFVQEADKGKGSKQEERRKSLRRSKSKNTLNRLSVRESVKSTSSQDAEVDEATTVAFNLKSGDSFENYEDKDPLLNKILIVDKESCDILTLMAEKSTELAVVKMQHYVLSENIGSDLSQVLKFKGYDFVVQNRELLMCALYPSSIQMFGLQSLVTSKCDSLETLTKEMSRRVQHLQETIKEEEKQWHKRWNLAIENVKKLYTVRYD